MLQYFLFKKNAHIILIIFGHIYGRKKKKISYIIF
jgi:hypothetical protein